MRRFDDIVSEALNISTDAASLRRLLDDALNELEFEYRLRARKPYVKLLNVSDIVFYGDIHGDLDTFKELSKRYDIDDHLLNGGYVVFLGDYIDRGYMQLETMVTLLLLKLEWRDRIVLLRGNHEPPSWLIPSPHDFPYVLVDRFGPLEGQNLYSRFMELFEYLPLALYIPHEVVAFHGGPPISRVLKGIEGEELLDFDNDPESIEEILWSDPIEEDVEWYYSYRGAGKLWGYKVTDRTLSALNVKMLIRGHEPVNGWDVRHRGRVLTLFSMKGYYGNDIAACLKLNLSEEEWSRNIDRHVITV